MSTEIKEEIATSIGKIINISSLGDVKFKKFDFENITTTVKDTQFINTTDSRIKADTKVNIAGPCNIELGWGVVNINVK